MASTKLGAAESREQHSEIALGIFPVPYGKLNGYVDFAGFY